MNKRTIIGILILVAIVIIGSVVWWNVKVEPKQAGIVVMDVWAHFPHNPESQATEELKHEMEVLNEWWYSDVQEVVENEIVPFITWARENKIPIVFSNMVDIDWDYEINPLLKWRVHNEPIINRAEDLDIYFKAKNVCTIYYVGFAINNCILGKPTGMIKMSELGYNVVLLENASLSGEYQIYTHEEALDIIKDKCGGRISTTNDVIRGLESG